MIHSNVCITYEKPVYMVINYALWLKPHLVKQNL